MDSLKEFRIIRLPTEKGVAHLFLGGEIDLSAIPKISSEFLDILAHSQPGDKLVIHFEAVTLVLEDRRKLRSRGVCFCDEDCVAMMVAIWRKLSDKGGKIFLVIPDPKIRKTFEVKGLHRFMTIVSDVSEVKDD